MTHVRPHLGHEPLHIDVLEVRRQPAFPGEDHGLSGDVHTGEIVPRVGLCEACSLGLCRRTEGPLVTDSEVEWPHTNRPQDGHESEREEEKTAWWGAGGSMEGEKSGLEARRWKERGEREGSVEGEFSMDAAWRRERHARDAKP